ncbi:MAG TPA: hypothetical protein PLF13_00470 [candidate division Zixibacteria bacterium]|nr:hypothetical protein [candidate division Zixibacteria bacterium]
MSIQRSETGLINRLKGILFKHRVLLVSAGIIATMAVVLAAIVLLALIANVAVLPVWLKISLLVVTGAAMLFVFGRYVAAKILAGSVDMMALRLEERYPELKGRLIAAVQFSRQARREGYSEELIALTERQAVEKTSGLNFNRALSYYQLLKTGKMLAVALFTATLLLTLAPGMFSHSYVVYSHPTEVIAPPLGYSLEAWPGSIQWIKYRDLEIGARLIGDQFPKEAVIHHRLAGGSWQETKIDIERGGSFSAGAVDTLPVTIKLRQVNKSLDYWVEAGRLKTEIQAVDVVDRPRVTGIKLSLFYPRYTGLEPAVIDENNGSFSAVVGSRVNIDVTTNLPITQAFLVFEDSSRTPLEVNGVRASTSLRVDESRAYYVRLIDGLGEQNPDPIEYYITAVPDEYPSVDIVRPGFDINLGEQMVVPLKARIYDDYGFSSLALKYTLVSGGQASEEHVAVLHFSDRIKTEGEIEFNWDINQYNLYPGDYVVYYMEVADNDRITGPKTSISRKYVARFPSLEEIVAETEAEAAQRITQTQEMLQQGKEAAERLKNITRKIQAQEKSSRQTDWQHQEELKDIAEQNSELMDQIQKTAEDMDKSIDKATENALLSRQILEKMAQVRKLFEEVATPEMKKAQEKLMEALKNMNREELQKAMQDYQMSLEEMLQRLERTMALLKRMQLEQKMEAMLRQLEQLAEQQEAVNSETDSTQKGNLPKLGQTESGLKKDLQQLKKQTSDLRDVAKEAEMDKAEELESFAQALEQTDADQNMEQMSQSLSEQQRDKAGEQGKQALSKLLQMIDQMQKSLASMQHNDAEEMMRAMQMAIDDANNLSQDQEDLYRQLEDLDSRSMAMHDQAEKQQDLESSCNGLKNRISELGKQSPFIAAELQRLVDEATAKMSLATEEMANRQKLQSMRSQREAMSRLNLAAIRLMESLQQQSQCNNGSNCNKPSQKLSSMCNKQNQLNMQTQQQCNNPGQSNPSQGESARQTLQRLASEQGTLRKSLEDLNKEFGDSRQILGRLDDIAREMKKVEEELASGNVGAETTERQLKIYSRLLEASRSLQRRDFTEQRQATSAKENIFAPPPALPSDMLDDRVKLEDRLRQYLSEDYPAQYEEQIKAYFRALLNSGADRTGGNEEGARP